MSNIHRRYLQAEQAEKIRAQRGGDEGIISNKIPGVIPASKLLDGNNKKEIGKNKKNSGKEPAELIILVDQDLLKAIKSHKKKADAEIDKALRAWFLDRR